MAEMTISSPSLTFLRPHELETRLIPSVVPRTKISSLVVLELRNCLALTRVSSYDAVERWLSSCTPRWMLAQSTSWKCRRASTTAVGFCAVAALSRYTRGLPWMCCLRTGKSSRIFSTSKAGATVLVSIVHHRGTEKTRIHRRDAETQRKQQLSRAQRRQRAQSRQMPASLRVSASLR